MSTPLARLAGQLFVVGFEGSRAPDELVGRIGASEVGAVMLFRPNIESPEQVADLVEAVRGAAPAEAPLLVAVDQEGGTVQRLRGPLTEWPDMYTVGAAGDEARTEAVGRALGLELRALGIAWNFAPVLDVHSNPQNPVIGRRAFGSAPDVVSAHALAFWRGLRGAGLLGCGKHFPGHGDTHTDSHHELPVVTHDEARLRSVELAPFAAAVAAGAEALMTAHVVYTAWDPALPATMSPRIIDQILRRELGYAGLVASDDLSMQAVAARWPVEETVVQGLLAGVDVFLIRGPEARQRAAFEGLVRAAEARSEVRSRLAASAARLAAFKSRAQVGLPAARHELRARLGPSAHQALAAAYFPEPRRM